MEMLVIFSVKDLQEKPVGTGPYKLVENKRGEYIKFEANENYYKGKPNVKKCSFTCYSKCRYC